ncbi:MAG: hypothetical protein Q4A75_06945 [Peptostreptococcaceae bacterium]|nr:hypothetical protein [Peptostreptococcaceae bacterium]
MIEGQGDSHEKLSGPAARIHRWSNKIGRGPLRALGIIRKKRT